MRDIDKDHLVTVTGGAPPAPAAKSFDARYADWLKQTEGKSAGELLRLPGAPLL